MYMKEFVAAFFILGCLGILLYTPSKFNKGIKLSEYGELTGKDKLLSWIPIYNMVSAERVYTGRGASFLVTFISLILAVALRVIVVLTVIDVFLLNVVSTLLCLAAFVAFLLANMRLVYIVLRDAGCMGFMQRLLYSIIYPIGQNYIGNYLPAILSAMLKEEDAFNGSRDKY